MKGLRGRASDEVEVVGGHGACGDTVQDDPCPEIELDQGGGAADGSDTQFGELSSDNEYRVGPLIEVQNPVPTFVVEAGEDKRVAAATACQSVIAGSPHQEIVTPVSEQLVVADAAPKSIGALPAGKRVP